MAKGFDSPKLTLIVGDGFEYMKKHQKEFDVIITDSSDPVGPAVNLFTENYFKLLKTALKPNGKCIKCRARIGVAIKSKICLSSLFII